MITDFNEYQSFVTNKVISLNKLKEKYPDLNDELIDLIALSYNGLGLGECGEVQGKIKKIIRDSGGVISEEDTIAIAYELGDILWYIADMCNNIGIQLSTVAEMNINKLTSRHSRNTVHGSGDYR